MARTTPGTGIPVPESPDPRTITADLWASFSKVGQLITQTSGESSAALVTAEQAETAAAQALARALLIEDPIHVGPSEPTDGEELWVDTDDDSSGGTGGEVTAADITDASTVGRAVLTAPLSVDARNALSIFTGTRALLDEGTDTAERTWDAKELHEYVTDTAGAASWDDLTGKPETFPPEAHTHALDDVDGLQAFIDLLTYDSGLRNVSSLLANGWTGTAYLQRTAKDVTLRLEGITAPAPGSTSPFAYPLGYQPRGTAYASRGLLFTTATNPVVRRYDVAASTGALTVRNHSAGDVLYGEINFKTNKGVPTGTPPGSNA